MEKLKEGRNKIIRSILGVCALINCLIYILYLVVIMAAFLKSNGFCRFFLGDAFLYIHLILGLPILVLWFYSLKIWAKYDKDIEHFLLLFFFIGFYPPFYYLRMIRNNWI
ncbi:hypothetical protein [Parabacteroides sp. FAFU027]|uniref:hypothetical protein n=1 Tax=Parabacteroides sp. FAFU027 TaxID=2922715 RepID=UPI001FAE944A|nr:hypothetical protein [Parabacteroides sp. FAFU027]